MILPDIMKKYGFELEIKAYYDDEKKYPALVSYQNVYSKGEKIHLIFIDPEEGYYEENTYQIRFENKKYWRSSDEKTELDRKIEKDIIKCMNQYGCKTIIELSSKEL